MKIFKPPSMTEEVSALVDDVAFMLNVSLVNFVIKYRAVDDRLNIGDYNYVLNVRLVRHQGEGGELIGDQNIGPDRFGTFRNDDHLIDVYFDSILDFLDERDADLPLFDLGADIEDIQHARVKIYLFIIIQFLTCRSLLSFNQGLPILIDNKTKRDALDALSACMTMEMVYTSWRHLNYMLAGDCVMDEDLKFFLGNLSPSTKLGVSMFTRLRKPQIVGSAALSVEDMIRGWYSRLDFQEPTPLYVESLLSNRGLESLGQLYLLFHDWVQLHRRARPN